jgi:hypothetical protein
MQARRQWPPPNESGVGFIVTASHGGGARYHEIELSCVSCSLNPVTRKPLAIFLDHVIAAFIRNKRV